MRRRELKGWDRAYWGARIYGVCEGPGWRGLLASNKKLAAKVHTLEREVSVHERNIFELADSMASLLATPPAPPKRPIGFVTPEGKPSKKASAQARRKG